MNYVEEDSKEYHSTFLLRAIASGNDVFVALLTWYGKLLCNAMQPLVFGRSSVVAYLLHVGRGNVHEWTSEHLQ